jgi:YesN/AraC family two-component response regulator
MLNAAVASSYHHQAGRRSVAKGCLRNAFFGKIEVKISGTEIGFGSLIDNHRFAIIKILLIANDSENENATSTYDENISAILKYLGDNFRSRLTLEDISEATHISKYYLCHSFKQHLNMTIFEYILAKRISYAKRLLVYSDMSISRISIESGFSDFAYFSKIFKKSEGLSPKEYRINNK